MPVVNSTDKLSSTEKLASLAVGKSGHAPTQNCGRVALCKLYPPILGAPLLIYSGVGAYKWNSTLYLHHCFMIKSTMKKLPMMG